MMLELLGTGNMKIIKSIYFSGFDQSGVYTSRCGTLCIPFVVQGQLERGEEFKLSTENDAWIGVNDQVNIAPSYRGFESWNSMFGSDLSHQVPTNTSECLFKIEYQNYGDSAWTCADNVCFTYECHNKSKGVSNSSNFTSDGNNQGDKTQSSNIKGMPRFRICLNPQNKLLQYYMSTNSNAANQIFNALGRQVDVHLKYSKSAKKNIKN